MRSNRSLIGSLRYTGFAGRWGGGGSILTMPRSLGQSHQPLALPSLQNRDRRLIAKR